MVKNAVKNIIHTPKVKGINKIILLLFIITFGKTQYSEYDKYSVEKIYDKRVYSIQFYKGNNPLSPPFINLNSPEEFLTLEFDILSTEVLYDLELKIIPVDRNWEPLNIIESEFFQGFTTLQITNFEVCENCLRPYVHYHITFPQPQDRFLKSGNYILIVYSIDEPEKILFSRRFWVIESILPILANREISPNTETRTSVQYINFTIKPSENILITDPSQEIDVVILQNYDWNSRVIIDKPTYIYPDKYEYVIEPQQFFQANNEFRIINLSRILTGRGGNIQSIQFYDTGYVAKLLPDRPRYNKPYFSYTDLNGAFIIHSKENNDSETQAEYILTQFFLLTPIKYEGDVYIYGKISDWGNDTRFKMHYLPEYSMYTLTIPLKQGIYNYLYAIKKQNNWDIKTIEGSFYETENTYSIFIYYRPFGERYDRIVGFYVFNSYD